MPFVPRPGDSGWHKDVTPPDDASRPKGGPRSNPRGATRLSQGGRLIEDPRWPRMGIIGEPGMQLELATNPEYTHAVVTVLGGSSVAAAGFPPDMIRQHARACMKLADLIEKRHGRQESGRV